MVKGGEPSGHSKIEEMELRVQRGQERHSTGKKSCRETGLPRSAEGSLEYSAAR